MLRTHWLSLIGRRRSSKRRRQKSAGVPVAEHLENRTLLTTFCVNAAYDAVDANPGDGIAADAAGNSTLRSAIQEANALEGEDVIVVPEGTYALSLWGYLNDNAAAGDLDILDDLTIVGVGSDVTIIDADQLDRVLQVFPGVDLDLSGVTLTNGLAEWGGAILNGGALTIANSAVTDSEATLGGGGIYNWFGSIDMSECTLSGNLSEVDGGGLTNEGGNVEVIDSTFSDNQADDDGGAVFNLANGILSITTSTIRDNVAEDFGGGIENYQSTLYLLEATVAGNRAENSGGGIGNGGGVVEIDLSTISGNTAEEDGGGILNDQSLMTLTSSTISGNSVQGRGGGIANNANSTLTSINCTITDNLAIYGGGGVQNSGLFRPGNTIIAGNELPYGSPDVNGYITTLGHNLIGSVKGTDGVVNGVSGDLVGASVYRLDPLLGPLQDNGGETLTHALLEDSPAIDAGMTEGAPIIDQRDMVRPLDGDDDGVLAIDIGSVEFDLIPDNTFTVDSTLDTPDVLIGDGISADADGNSTLRSAIQEANVQPGEQTIVLSEGTYTLTRGGTREDLAFIGDLDIAANLTIEGAGAEKTIIDAAAIDRVFHVLPGVVLNLSGVTVTGGFEDSGAGILNQGVLTIEECIVTDNSAERSSQSIGGGITNDGGEVTITESTISSNTSRTDGGGIYNARGIVRLFESTLDSNEAGTNGGGLYNAQGTVRLSDSTLSANTARTDGGGLYNAQGIVRLFESTVTANDAKGGGGLFNLEGLMSLVNVTVSGNTGRDGGGLFNAANSTLTTANSTIADNVVRYWGGGVYNEGLFRTANTIIAKNRAADGGRDVSGSATTAGYNLIGDGRGSSGFQHGVFGDQVGTAGTRIDPFLDELANNGGLTLTHMPLENSPAVDAGANEMAPLTDQRGVLRPYDGDDDGVARVDIGSVERKVLGFDMEEGSDFTLRRSGEALVLVDNTTGDVVWGRNFDSLDSLRINGSLEDDSLTVDFADGDPIPLAGISFDGGSGTDVLKLDGGTFTSISHALGESDEGEIELDESRISYADLEVHTDLLEANERVFVLSALADDVTIGDDSNPDGGVLRILNTPSVPIFDFLGPTATLTIDAGHGNDIVTFGNPDSLFSAAVAIDGGTGDDQLDASPLSVDVAFSGGEGDDRLLGGAGDDSLFGGTGIDYLDGGAGNDSLSGQGDGLNTLTGGEGDDTLDGSTGSDVLEESGDVNFVLTDDSLTGLGTDLLIGFQTVQLTGGDGDNSILADQFSGQVTLIGGAGNDTLTSGNGQDWLFGGDGNDRLEGGAGNDSLWGQDGHDTLVGAAGLDSLFGGTGNDQLEGGDDWDTLDGEDGDDSLNGGTGDDVLLGAAGADLVAGSSGNDLLKGGADNDTLLGGDGNDSLFGGDGDNVLDGGPGNNYIHGQESGSTGTDLIIGPDSDIDESFQIPSEWLDLI